MRQNFISAFAFFTLFGALTFSHNSEAQTQPADQSIVLTSNMTVRTLKSDVLEKVGTLPAGTEVSVEDNAQPINNAYKNDKGQEVFSSTGFIGKIQIVKSSLTASQISKLNSMSSGLYLSAVILDQLQTGLEFVALQAGSPTDGYTKNYQPSGKPNTSFTTSVTKRFPQTLNKVVKLGSSDKKKWTRIMQELQRVADRTRNTDKTYFIVDPEVANQQSIEFEINGVVPDKGAWSVAVLGTAARNGFQNVPCAEFMGEVIRQAYKRAGYSHFDDFSAKKANELAYHGGAALVENFSNYLNKAGWIPWDAQVYAPPTGAVVMNGSGKSPGHTYMAAGDNGRFIFDNGSPQGRDLRSTSMKTIELMYMEGVFFLPPGLTPKKW